MAEQFLAENYKYDKNRVKEQKQTSTERKRLKKIKSFLMDSIILKISY